MKPVRAPLSGPLADQVYDILVGYAGASEALNERAMFVNYVARDESIGGDRSREYRFVGTLGFGGKFYINGGICYVSCYREDATAERDETIKRTNEALTRLMENTKWL